MREIMRTEMKDLKAANMTLEFEITRIQSLFRQLQTELLQTMEEKKAQNSEILRTFVDKVEDDKLQFVKEGGNTLKARSQSLSASGKPSVQSLLPKIKVATQESVTKLTHRQLKVADILKRGQNPSGFLSPARHLSGGRRLIQDNSMMSLGSNANFSNENLVFLTAAAGQSQNGQSTVDLKKNVSQTEQKVRKPFGAEDYL